MSKTKITWRKVAKGQQYDGVIETVGKISIHHHIYSNPDVWHVTARWIDLVSAELEARDLAAAKLEAMNLIHDAIYARMNEDARRAIEVEKILPG